MSCNCNSNLGTSNSNDCEPNNNIRIQTCAGYGFTNRCNCCCPPQPRRRPWNCDVDVDAESSCNCCCDHQHNPGIEPRRINPANRCCCGCNCTCGCDHNHNPGIEPRRINPADRCCCGCNCGCGCNNDCDNDDLDNRLKRVATQAAKCTADSMTDYLLDQVDIAKRKFVKECVEGLFDEGHGCRPPTIQPRGNNDCDCDCDCDCDSDCDRRPRPQHPAKRVALNAARCVADEIARDVKNALSNAPKHVCPCVCQALKASTVMLPDCDCDDFREESDHRHECHHGHECHHRDECHHGCGCGCNQLRPEPRRRHRDRDDKCSNCLSNFGSPCKNTTNWGRCE